MQTSERVQAMSGVRSVYWMREIHLDRSSMEIWDLSYIIGHAQFGKESLCFIGL
jgi:hypothetical protein